MREKDPGRERRKKELQNVMHALKKIKGYEK
jgi:hypothetical protein